MKSYFGSFYSSHGAAPQPSSVLIFDKNINIGFRNADGTTTTLDWVLKNIDASFDFSTQSTRLKYNSRSGQEVLIEGNDAFSFVKEMQAELQKPWHKKSGAKDWTRNLLLLAGLLGLLFLLYLLIVPWLAEKMVSRVSPKTEQQLGNAVYEAMNLSAQEDTAASYVLNEFFAAMDVPTPYRIKITVVNDNVVNAFALPGGRIVVYSALLKQIQSYPELAALLSHEFTHINNKHSTKSIFRRLGSKIFLGLLFGKFGSVTSVLVDHADNLKSLKYSRKLEKEADTEGLAILKQRKIDPQGFVSLFNHLKESAPSNSIPEFLGSHPDIEKRIKHINESSANVQVQENRQLKTIFEKLNQNTW
jgi:beta-barrel assembly-enhancing protease